MKSLKKIKTKPSMKKNITSQAGKKVKGEVNRILQQNMEPLKLEQTHIPFASRFLNRLLSEQEDKNVEVPEDSTTKSPEDFTPETNQQDFQKSLESTTEPDTFDTDGVSPDVTSNTINSIKEWSGKLDDFASFLNDPSTESLHKILADGDRAGSLLRGVTRKASDSITRIAGEVEKLKEILNTYIITAPKKLRDTEQQTAGYTQY
jgi:hypothetical protein